MNDEEAAQRPGSFFKYRSWRAQLHRRPDGSITEVNYTVLTRRKKRQRRRPKSAALVRAMKPSRRNDAPNRLKCPKAKALTVRTSIHMTVTNIHIHHGT
jgi:hypothetical protein